MWTLNYILSAFFHFCSLGTLLNRYGKGTLTVFNSITRKWFLDKCKEWKHFRSFWIGKNLPGLTEWALNVQGMNLFHKSHSAGLPPVTECSLPHKVVHFILHSSDNHLKYFPLKFSKYLHFSFHSPAQFQPSLPHRPSSIPLSHKCFSSQQRMQPQLLRPVLGVTYLIPLSRVLDLHSFLEMWCPERTQHSGQARGPLPSTRQLRFLLEYSGHVLTDSYWAGDSLVAQQVKNLPVMQEIWVQSLDQEDPLEEGMATHSGILTWRIPLTEEPGRLQSMGSQRVRLDWTTNHFTFKLVLSEQPWALFHLSLHRSTHHFSPASLPELPSREHNTTSSLRGLLPSESILPWDLPSPSGHQA